MKIAITAIVMLHAAGATAAYGQPAGRSVASIPAQFHGRWAKDQRACRPKHFTDIIAIDDDGWSGFEAGGEVTRVGQVRRGTHYFRLNNRAGEEKTTGSLAMRRDGSRIVMTFDDDNAQPVHYTLIRCR